MSATSWFENVPNIPYEGPNSDNPLAFTHYNADEMVAGKSMRDHLRFAVCYWHAMRDRSRSFWGGLPVDALVGGRRRNAGGPPNHGRHV